jgi:hypothetical protein
MSTLECFQHGKHLIAIVLSAAGEIEIQSHPPLSPPNSGKCTSIAVMRASWSVLCTTEIYKMRHMIDRIRSLFKWRKS